MKALEQSSKASILSEQNRYDLLDICDAIEYQKCVLILGDYAFSRPSDEAPNGEEYLRELLLRKKRQLVKEDTGKINEDILSIAASCLNKGGLKQPWLRTHMDLSLEELGPRQLQRFKQISEIKFDLILSTYPHDLLPEIFERNGIEHEFSYYNYYSDPKLELSEPSMSQPLIYNLFGSGKKNKQSIVNTTERLYEFLDGVMGARRIPPLIEDKISQATHLIFLGFSFDDWYMKILLWLFRGAEKKESVIFSHSLSSRGMINKEKMFFQENFQVSFLEMQIDEFISALYESCKENNLLRNPSQRKTYDKLKKLEDEIQKYKLKAVFRELNEIILNQEGSSDLIKEMTEKVFRLEYKFNELEDEESYESYTKEELDDKRNDLKKSLQKVLKKLGKLDNK